jgi:hypothetical protein
MSVDVVSAAPATYAPPAALCLNCAAPLAGHYCARCGQRAVTGRLTVASLAADFAGQFLALDRGLWFTVLAVARDPGGVARRYLDGQRRRFVGPIAFLSFTAALLLIAMQLTGADDLERIRQSARSAWSGPHAIMTARQGEAYARLLQSLSQQTALTSLMLAVPFALVVRRLFRKAGVNLAECAVLSLYTFGDACALYVLIAPTLYLFGNTPSAHTTATFAVYLAVCVHAARGFFGRRVGTAVRMVVAFGLSFLAFSVLLSAGVITYVLLRVPR